MLENTSLQSGCKTESRGSILEKNYNHVYKKIERSFKNNLRERNLDESNKIDARIKQYIQVL